MEVEPVSAAASSRWELDLGVLAALLRGANGLRGRGEALDDRLFFIGDAYIDGKLTACVLALVGGDREARRHLGRLPTMLPKGYARIAAVCPGYAPSVSTARELQSQRITVVAFPDDDSLNLDLAAKLSVDVACEFRRDGEGWTIAWEGRRHRLRHVGGLAYIAMLLARPHESISATDLVGTSTGTREEGDHRDVLADTDRVDVIGDAGEHADREARAAYRRQVSTLEKEIASARSQGALAKVAQYERERGRIVQELSRVEGRWHRPRRARSTAERARTNVKKRIDLAILAIAKQDAGLAAYLDNAIETGLHLMYRPDRPIPWLL